jgi:hypothetical protein
LFENHLEIGTSIKVAIGTSNNVMLAIQSRLALRNFAASSHCGLP